MTFRIGSTMTAAEAVGAHMGTDEPHTTESSPGVSRHSRRAIVREGVKLAFVAPALATFFAGTAYAGTEKSCLVRGSPCTTDAQCCNTLECQPFVGVCYRP